jgi:hypothetical protein
MLNSKMKGYQMGKYKIRVKVEFVEGDDTKQHSPMKQNDGSFEMSMQSVSIIVKQLLCEHHTKRFVMH